MVTGAHHDERNRRQRDFLLIMTDDHRQSGSNQPQSQPQPQRKVEQAGKPQPYSLSAEDFTGQLPAAGALLGIDPGTMTLGLALSDLTRMIASGLETIRRTKFKADSARLLSLIDKHKVCGLVIGFPINLDGSEGPRAQSTRAFARNIARLVPLPILLWDERMSTMAAERTLLEADSSRARRARVIDKMAATIILQGALDRMRLI